MDTTLALNILLYTGVSYAIYLGIGLITLAILIPMLGSRMEHFLKTIGIKGLIWMAHTWPYGLYETYRTQRAFKKFMRKIESIDGGSANV